MRPARTRRALVILVAAVAAGSLSGPASALVEIPARIVIIDPPVSEATYPGIDFRGPGPNDDRELSTAWRVVEETGNCCETYLTSTPGGRLLDFGGRYVNFSDDRGQTWRSVQPLARLMNGEGAIVAAPGGDVLGVEWDPYSGDHLQFYKFEADTQQWLYTEMPVHQPFYDREWISVLPGPVTIDGETHEYVSFVKGGLPKEVWFYSTDGLNYTQVTSKDLDRFTSGAVTEGPLPTAGNPLNDWVQPNTNGGMIQLGSGDLLASPDFMDGWSLLDGETFTWSSYTFPDGSDPQGLFQVDSAGRIHNVIVSEAGDAFDYRVSSDGGESWRAITVQLPADHTVNEIDFRANRAAGVAAVAMRAHDEVTDTDQDLVYKLSITRPTPRVLRLYEVGLGDMAAVAGVGNSVRFDFESVTIFRDGRLAVSFLDSTTTIHHPIHGTEQPAPALAVEGASKVGKKLGGPPPEEEESDPEAWVFDPHGLSADRFPAAGDPEVVEIPAHDGVMLHSRVYRPDTSSTPSWKTPVILVHSPYFDYFYEAVLPATPYQWLIDRFTPKGYTVVLSDVRGTGDSGGCLEQDGINQAQDFKTLVEHFASQPWSNGRVGSYGASYDGETQNAGAVLRPRGLATVVPTAAISGLYDVAYFDAVPFTGAGAGSAAFYAIDNQIPAGHPERVVERPGCQPANIIEGGDPSGDMTPYWAEREFRTKVRSIRASVLYVQGFSDRTVAPINIDGWYDRIPTFKRAIFGQWQHAYPDSNHAFARDDWKDAVHAWFDHELLGLTTGIRSWPPVQVQDEVGGWRAARSFAGLGKEETLRLGDGTIGSSAPSDTTVSFDETGQVVWESAPLEEELHLSGQVYLSADITLDRSDAHFGVLVEEITAAGDVQYLTNGYLSAPHRESLSSPSPVPVGERVRYQIRTFPFDQNVAPGSMLRVSLFGADLDTLPAGSGYTAEVRVDGATRLVLPVVDQVCGLAVNSRTPLPSTYGCDPALRKRILPRGA
ncbi:MAG: CocE/NonD family hydrolase [Actinomycetota bacterium]